MYEPQFKNTDRLVLGLVKLEQHKTSMISHDLNFTTKQKLMLQAKSLDIFHLAHNLGVEMTLKNAERFATGLTLEDVDPVRAQILNNFRDTIDFNRSNLADTYAEVDSIVLMHIHKMITKDWKESWQARFRNISDTIDLLADNWSILRDESIDPATVESEVNDLIQWYKDTTPTIAPVVRIGIFLFRLLEIYPFIAGNKLSILTFADYLLYKNGFSAKLYYSTLRNFDAHEQRYIDAISNSKINKDMSFWLEAFVFSMIKDISDTKESISEFIKEDERVKSQPFLDLNKRQLKVLRYLQTVPSIKREDYCHMMEVSTMTAFRDLTDLVEKKLIKIEGLGRGTKYRLSSR